jgi:tetratricopeptide (TPR) repeat protein
LDSDDVWYKEKLKTSYNVIKKNPDADLVCNDEYLIVNGKKIGIMKYGPAKENMYQWLLTQGNCISGSASVVKKEKIVNAGMFSSNPNFEGVEDYELWIRLSKIGKFYFIYNILGEYRVGEHNTSKKVERQVEHEKNVIEHYLAQEEDKSMQEAKKRYAKIYFGAGWGLHRQGEFNECISWYKKAIKEDPLFYKSYFGLLLAATRIRW